MLDICGWSGGCRNYWGKMDTNEMLMRHRLQVAPLTLLCSGGLSVPTPFPCDPSRDLLGCRQLLLSLQHGRGPPIGSSLFAPCMVFILWFEYMQMLQWSPVKGNTHHILPTAHPHPSPFIFPAPFLFVSLHAAAFSAVWAESCGNQICFVTQIYLNEEWDC